MGLPQSRLESLYKDFRPLQELNYDGYQANIATWKKYLLSEYSPNVERLTMKIGDDFLRSLNQEVYGIPKSIDVVIDSMVSDGTLVTIEDFTNGLLGNGEGSNVVGWFKSKLGFSRKFVSRKDESSTGYMKEMELIHKQNLIKISEKIHDNIKRNIIRKITSFTGCILCKEEFCQKAGISEVVTDKEDVEILIKYLDYYKNILVYDKEVIKLLGIPESWIIDEGSKNRITENDVKISEVKDALFKIKLKIGYLENKNDKQMAKILDKNIGRETRKEYLIGKKIIDKHLSNLLRYKNNLLEMKNQIDASATNNLLVKTLTASHDILKSLNDYTGSVENVEVLLNKIEDQKHISEDINEALASTNLSYDENIIDDTELESDLKKLEDTLEKENKTKEKKAKEYRTEGNKETESSNELLGKLSQLSIKDDELNFEANKLPNTTERIPEQEHI
ncbi:hypothetical protein TPHA_0I02610 [Tetrapisispora phaffii CBS 4417]|uniref:Uncharacterized protein n=1 Tax=Tetrapisispora phaffii (strain ATCC 24235 / CBS 4417 / NBRC 1672 / NRRL Y-8282 / UCD 70-5) TaxID=1071381 RepID=G8BXY4_TETPH|nr:hypothetical protein TPHA_0I02610 [Tetrapisispora phaffii CBS 4417]CCE64762.1 hypothetical protein TPHA_0I02610 [Tetrapisispora phaffii CBS 4417]